MDVEFDAEKDAKNRELRGLPLALGAVVIANAVAEIDDLRADYGERRVICFGTLAGRLHVCVYTRRGDVFRVISLRRANSRERRRWQR